MKRNSHLCIGVFLSTLTFQGQASYANETDSLTAQTDLTQATETLATTTTNELIVRLRRPVETGMRVTAETLGLTARDATTLTDRLTTETLTGATQTRMTTTHTTQTTARAEVVNAEMGVIKLKFKDAQTMTTTLDRLLKSTEVEDATTNQWYTPQFKVRFKPTEETETQDTGPLSMMSFSKIFKAIPKPVSRIGVDPLIKSDWAYKDMGIDRIAAEKGKIPMTVAVIDTGVDYTHPDLQGSLWRKPGAPTVIGYDFAHDNARPFDMRHFDLKGCLNDAQCKAGIGQNQFLTNPGHGTFCAGRVGATGGNSIGIRGVNFGGKIAALKMFHDFGEENAGAGDDAAAVKSIDFAIKNQIKVISASWGGRQTRQAGERSELKNALLRAQAAGVIVVVAAGNDGIDQDQDVHPSFPAAFNLDNMIVVGATDQKDTLASFSNYGAQSVHIAAPGVKIISTISGGGYNDIVASEIDPATGKKVEMIWEGTSMATPNVAGAVALVWSKFPNANYHQIRDRILKTARHVPLLEGKIATAGVLDVASAMDAP